MTTMTLDPPPEEHADDARWFDVLRDTGLTYRKLDHWTRKGHLRADNPTPGTGYRRQWPPGEVDIARAMVRLIDCGFSLAAAARIARQVTEAPVEIPLCCGVTLRVEGALWKAEETRDDGST